ncbi:hypothetical protein H2136_14215 [Aeromonas hydrophila]|uniref:Uncharacterized protein n=1 Tax=Aeromonas hydrophila TaxID=644 RepID=A0A926FLG9_AERHY|nr:hypothetical protein [Aeromonas hydrophila]
MAGSIPASSAKFHILEKTVNYVSGWLATVSHIVLTRRLSHCQYNLNALRHPYFSAQTLIYPFAFLLIHEWQKAANKQRRSGLPRQGGVHVTPRTAGSSHANSV